MAGMPSGIDGDDREVALRELVEAGRAAVEQGLTQASGGNLSARLSDGSILVTGKGTWLNSLGDGSFAHISTTGEVLDGVMPSSEWRLHTRIYESRPDVKSVVHVHPQLVLLLAALRRKIRFITQDHAVYVNSYETVPYFANGSDELATTAARALLGCNAVILEHHGTATVGASVEQALRIALNFEEAARLTYYALALGDSETSFPDDRRQFLFHL